MMKSAALTVMMKELELFMRTSHNLVTYYSLFWSNIDISLIVLRSGSRLQKIQRFSLLPLYPLPLSYPYKVCVR